jgi:RNA polymerase sigma factor (sigma-70 family)
MTVLINAIPWAIRVKAIDGQTPGSDADDRARRLAAAIERGDEAAFVELYDRYRKRLFRFALALAHGDDAQAHDTVQSAFLTAAAKLRSVQGEEHLWNWLASVARQHLSKAWRQQRRDAVAVSMAEVPERPDFELDRVLEERLDRALQSMDEPDRQLIEWFYFDGQSQKDIAQRMSATPKAISSRLERARARLRGLLAHHSSEREA